MALILRRGKVKELSNYVRPYRAGFMPVSTFKIDGSSVEFRDNDIPSEDHVHSFALRESDDVIISGEIARRGLIRSYAIYNLRTRSIIYRNHIRNFIVGLIFVAAAVYSAIRLHEAGKNGFTLFGSMVFVPLILLFSAIIIIPGLKTLGSVNMIKRNI